MPAPLLLIYVKNENVTKYKKNDRLLIFQKYAMEFI